MIVRLLATAVLVVGVITHQAVALLANGKVHVLKTGNFEQLIKENPLTFVEFYAPWCDHCKKLAPEWEKTAVLAQEIGIPLAMVDGIAEEGLARKHRVESFPTLKLYRGDSKIAKKYEGPRTAQEMAKWLKNSQEASLIETLDDSLVHSWAAGKKQALIGLQTSGTKNKANMAMMALLEAASFMLNAEKPGSIVRVGVATAGNAEIKALGLTVQPPLPCVIFVRDFDFESRTVIYPKMDEREWVDGLELFLSWFEQMHVPKLIPAQENMQQFFLQGSAVDIGHGLVILFTSEKQLAQNIHELAITSFAAENRLKWVHAREDSFGESLAKSVGLSKNDFPELIIWEFGDTEDEDKVFRFTQLVDTDKLSREFAEVFVRRWLDNDFIALNDPVLNLTSDNFDDYVIDSQHEVLVQFYAPQCARCKDFAPLYKEVATHYIKDTRIRIAKMDVAKSADESARKKSYPTFKFYLKGMKNTPIDMPFKANTGKQDIIKFIETYRDGQAENRKESENDAKDEHVAKTPAAPAQTPVLPANCSADLAENMPVWIFDDAADPLGRGEKLSDDMVHSRGGYTLVQYGRVGILVLPTSASRAVRKFDTSADVKAYVQGFGIDSENGQKQSVGTVLKNGGLPCPVNADLFSCKAWCEGVVDSVETVRIVVGGSCKNWKGKNPQQQPQCNCYGDDDYKIILAMCLSPCH